MAAPDPAASRIAVCACSEDVTATIFHLLGVDPHGVVHDRENRPHTIAHGRPVDTLLRERPEARARVHEVHPEVAFHALNGGRPLGLPKKGRRAREGLDLRRALLAAAGLPGALIASRAKGVPEDDHLDALHQGGDLLHLGQIGLHIGLVGEKLGRGGLDIGRDQHLGSGVSAALDGGHRGSLH